MNADCLLIIPARGGSKGVPRKNLTSLAGRPMVAHTIEAGLRAERVCRVVVSTDDAEIALVARRFGAEVVERPLELATDIASSEDALIHCLDHLERAEGYTPRLVAMAQCTSPLTSSADIDGAIAAIDAEQADSCFTAVPFYHFLWKQGGHGAAEGINHAGRKRKRRQDLEPQYLENGAVYVMRTQAFRAERDRFCGKTVLHIVSADRCLEIDTPIDLLQAEVTMRARQQLENSARLPEPLGALVMDFDGVFTDNRVFVTDDGHESVACDRGDGLGLGLLAELEIPLLILSKERNPVVRARGDKLGIPVLQAIDDKPAALQAWLSERNIDPGQVVFVGNDINDLGCMHLVGCAVAPADAHPRALAAAAIVLQRPGGRGALRELCDLIVERVAGR